MLQKLKIYFVGWCFVCASIFGPSGQAVSAALSQVQLYLDVHQDGKMGMKWSKAIQSRYSKKQFELLKNSVKPLSANENQWSNLIEVVLPKWEKQLKTVQKHFPKGIDIGPIEIVMGNQGGNDGFTFSRRTICLDLSSWQKNYGSPFEIKKIEENKSRIIRILNHEYAHLLTKAMLVKNPFFPKSFKEDILFQLYFEGIGHVFSLSSKWVDKDYKLTPFAMQKRDELLLIYKKRMKKIDSGSTDPALVDKMVMGNFADKWGALTIALFLADGMSKSPNFLIDWIPQGPSAIAEFNRGVLKPGI